MMRRKLMVGLLCIALSCAPCAETNAGFWVVVQQVIKEVIKAMDLAVQRLQNKTIWLQNAQKALENEMAKLKLDQIGEWVAKQENLYSQYYEELRQVKELIALFQQVRGLSAREASMLKTVQQAMQMFRSKGHFTSAEIAYIEKVYSGILQASMDDIDQLTSLLRADILSMHDADRLRLIAAIGRSLDTKLRHLQEFTRQNQVLSLQRSQSFSELQDLQKLYGIQ